MKPYTDAAGKISIGVGRNLTDVGISEDEADYLLDNDISSILHQLVARIAIFGSLDTTRQNVLADMAMNLGIEGLLRFHKMLAAIEAHDFEKAADEMLDSKWATQVGKRATELAAMMRTGVA